MSAYPHPVLTAKTDDISGDISFIPEFVNNALHIKNIKVSNKYLTNLLGSQKAKFSLIIENSAAFFSQHYTFNSNEHWVNFNSNDFPKGSYSAELTIVTDEAIVDYTDDSFHEDYNGFSFTLSQGAILANFGYWKFDIRKDFSKLGEKESIIKWLAVDDDNLRGNFKVTTLREKLCITYFKQDRVDIIAKLQDKSVALIHSAYIVPAIMYGISLLSDQYEAYNSETWALTILNSMYTNNFIDEITGESVKYSIDNYGLIFIANKIVNDPLIKISNLI